MGSAAPSVVVNHEMDKILNAIYFIKNKLTGKFYVGSARDIAVRWRCHRTELRANKHHSCHLQAAWNKYGEDAFEWQVIERDIKEDHLEVTEQRYLDYVFGLGQQYNICRVAGNCTGRPVSEETRKKMRDRKLGKRQSAESRRRKSEAKQGEKNHFFGQTHSDETRAKIKAARANQVFTLESNMANAKPVARLDLDGKILEVFYSGHEAMRAGHTRQLVAKCCRTGQVYRNSLWKILSKEEYLQFPKALPPDERAEGSA